jgi:hypothetical protein
MITVPRDDFLRRRFDYRPGDHVTIIGPTGSGKTWMASQLPAPSFNGVAVLRSCLSRSRMKPILRVPERYRDAEPWSLITERMTGEHRWTSPTVVHDQDCVLVLDRNGSYPSACSSVPVCANGLRNTGRMEMKETVWKAGLFRVVLGTMIDGSLPHPLGRYGAQAGKDPIWITTPHLLLINRMHHAGVMKASRILDSWTGKRTDGLFSEFSKEVQKERTAALNADDTERYQHVKTSSSIALRLLWSQSKSPFYRPDWSVSVRAEAAVRHWLRAWQMTMEPQEKSVSLLRLGNVDEVAVLVRCVSVEHGWCPAPYVLGTTYGKVKVKKIITGQEWKAEKR